MHSLISKLFSSRRNRTIRYAPAPVTPRKPARARLGLEGLEAREVPALLSPLNLGSFVLVQCDSANDTIRITNPQVNGVADLTRVQVTDVNNTVSYTFPTAGLTQISVYGNDGDDNITNETAVESWLDGGAGSDTLRGGSGRDFLVGGSDKDILYGSPGQDQYNGGSGQDVLYREGYHAVLNDANTTDYDLTVGLATERLNAKELQATGEMVVSLSGDQLIFNGPGGAGFAMKSGWVRDGNSYKTTSAVTLQTTYGDVTLPNVGGVATTVVLYGSSPVNDADVYKKITWGGVPVTGSTNLLGGVMDKALGNTGVNMSLPGLTWVLLAGAAGRTAREFEPHTRNLLAWRARSVEEVRFLT